MGATKKTDDFHISMRCQNCQRDFLISHLQFPFDDGDDIVAKCNHCGTNLFFSDYINWGYPHRRIREPIQYHDLSELEVQAHFQRLAARSSDVARMELYLCGSETSVSVSKHHLQTKSDRLSFLLRTSSVGSERLSELASELDTEGYDLRLRFSPKRKILNQISVLIETDDPLMSISAANLLRTIAKKLNCPEPLTFIAGYYEKEDERGLPGRKIKRRFPYVLGVIGGLIIGCIIGFVAVLCLYWWA